MTSRFVVRTTSAFDRSLRKLSSRHAELADLYADVLNILSTDPYNRSGTHSIKKLVDVRPGYGQYRIRAGRFVFGTTSKIRSSTSNSVRSAVKAPIADSGLNEPRNSRTSQHSTSSARASSAHPRRIGVPPFPRRLNTPPASPPA